MALLNNQYDQALRENLHPAHWQNPTPTQRYNMVVVGGGTAGLVTALIAAGVGARVALVEKHLLGGDCLNVGCVPSKALIHSARVMDSVRTAQHAGVGVPDGVQVDFAAAMDRMRAIRARISHDDSVQRLVNEGVDVYLGEGQFTSRNTLSVDGQALQFKWGVVATGSKPFVPPIPGLHEAGYLTNETVFDLTTQPGRIAIVGAGPIGCELAQFFRRMGSDVVLLHNAAHILNREDADAAALVQQQFIREGIGLLLQSSLQEVTMANGKKVLHYTRNGATCTLAVDEVLMSTGRVPNIGNLGLDKAGVGVDDKRGVIVDDFLRTSNPNIYAAGDVAAGYWRFTHAADAAARIISRNAIFRGSERVSKLVMPWCTYTDPEIAHVGLYQHEAEEQGIAVDVFTHPFSKVDRAITDAEETGFVRVILKQGSDTILGATVVGRDAGDLLMPFTTAMVGGLGMQALASVITPYPTRAEAIRKAANAYMRGRLTPNVKRLFTGWIKLTG